MNENKNTKEIQLGRTHIIEIKSTHSFMCTLSSNSKNFNQIEGSKPSSLLFEYIICI